ncbi:acyl-CoA thioesterase [Staphylococcus aureus]|uniref:acyl-CoA thioesterase n=1 Tax=Staphylococcus aureus TaxID=1280 RepID=UPI00044D81E6|nr:thioesterase family protein [Staphylococcus aureus]EVD19227.1 acyl-CoA thioester hydrolase [Staphylococcus aureus SJOS6095]EVF39022.1 acyl-CoA thioester hydrolase [Staphylococcus aureus UCIM6047]
MIYSITEIEARYAETDKMGVIYHGNYATWFEVARLDYISKLGFSYADMEKQGIISPVTDLNVNYKKSIFYPEKGELATTGSTELICIKEDTFKPIRLDRYFPDWHEAYSKVQTLNNEGKTVEIMDGIDSL